MASNQMNGAVFRTRILPVNLDDLGSFKNPQTLEKWVLSANQSTFAPLSEAADYLKTRSIPVGFPTETVYGLGADATRSDAVKGIYKAKGRPSDNPLIIHVCDLTMLRDLISPYHQQNGSSKIGVDPIPEIYKPLIKKFWPGPLTILLPNPTPSKLAPEVTAGLVTFGARMPDSSLALSLIKIAGVPLAAPSANASTKPSPTTAEHVLHDLNGKVELILDGGPCQVGVESTVVDGLCTPPVVLRPGGVSIDRIRECEGWEGVVKGYKDQSEVGAAAPRAPGMKYKHYSPKATVILFEASPEIMTRGGGAIPNVMKMEPWRLVEAKNGRMQHLGFETMAWPVKIGIVSTKYWQNWAGFHDAKWNTGGEDTESQVFETSASYSGGLSIKDGQLWKITRSPCGSFIPFDNTSSEQIANLVEISLGKDTKDIAHGLFSALRELDQRGVKVIYVEGILDEGDIAAAVMNRLRKAATIIED